MDEMNNNLYMTQDLENEIELKLRDKLLSNPKYFNLIVESCNAFGQIDKCDLKADDELLNEFPKDINYLKVFYDGLNDYAQYNGILPSLGDNVKSGLYHVEYDGNIVTIAKLINVPGGISCMLSRGYEMYIDGIETIDFNDVMKFYQEQNILDNSQRKI